MPHTYTLDDYDAAAATIRARTQHKPTIGLVLGSGLNGLADQVQQADLIPYGDIPHFGTSTVPGHAGRLVIGELAGASVCVMQGRLHFYEGYSMQQITLPVRVMQRLGINTLILTNAAGGLNPTFAAGDLMVISDHINFVGMAGANPLSGPNLDALGPRFPAANRVYTRRLRALAMQVAADENINLQSGTYVVLSGPNFESPAEVRMWRMLGGDAVGMSTVPEALVAHHAGMEVLAISTITNMGVEVMDADVEPTHEDVVAAGAIIVPRLTALLMGVVRRMGSRALE